MNDIRRTVLWVIFGFSMVLLWDQWQVHNGQKATFFPAPAKTTAKVTESAPLGTSPVTAGNSVSSASVPLQGSVAVAGAGEKVKIATDLFNAEIDSQGGTLSQLQLIKYADQTEDGGLVEFVEKLFGYAVAPKEGKVVSLMEDRSPATRYVAQTGLINPVDSGDRFPNHLSPMTLKSGPRELASGQDTLDVTFESEPVGGLKYVKTYQFRRDSYAIRVKHELINMSNQPRDAQLYLQLVRHGTVDPGTAFGTNTFSGPAIYTEEKKFNKIEFTDITKKKAELPPPATNGWVAMVQHYFVSAWLIDAPGNEKYKREFRVADLGNNLYSVAMVLTLNQL
jgi:YidC/Oxa1 family membrane protein insertase